MNHNPWLTDRRWRWRVLVLLIVLAVFAAFMANGESLLGALAGVVAVFLAAAYVIDRIINDDKVAPPPANPLNLIPGGLNSLMPPGAGPTSPPIAAEDPGAGSAEPDDMDQAA